MTKSNAELPEQGAQTASRGARDLIPAENQYQPRTHNRTGAANGGTLVLTPEFSPGLAEEKSDSLWDDILAAASNPDFQQAEFVRLVLMEMSSACRELSFATGHSSREFKIKPLTAEIHALRTLAKTAHDLTEVVAQADVVNLDGPKFLYVLNKLIGAFKESMIQAGCAALESDTVIRLLADNLPELMAKIRRDIENAHTSTHGGATLACSQGEPNPSKSKNPNQGPVPNA
jgi:hypothetical protein